MAADRGGPVAMIEITDGDDCDCYQDDPARRRRQLTSASTSR